MITPLYQLTVDGLDPADPRVLSLVGTGGDVARRGGSTSRSPLRPATTSRPGRARPARDPDLANLAEKQRAFYGVVASPSASSRFSALGAAAPSLVVRVVPRLWLLKRKKRTRIFQRMRVPDIVTAVLLEAGIATRWQLKREYPVREYCTQYEETDYRFVKRLLAEAGIYFYFFGRRARRARRPRRRRRRARRGGRGQQRGRTRGRLGRRVGSSAP